MSALALGSWELWNSCCSTGETLGKQRVTNQGGIARSCRHILGTYGREGCLQIYTVLLSERGCILCLPEKMKAMKSGLYLLPVFSPFLPRPWKRCVHSAIWSYCQPFLQAQRRGDRRQIAELENKFMVVRKTGQVLFFGPVHIFLYIFVAMDWFTSTKTSRAAFSILVVANSP